MRTLNLLALLALSTTVIGTLQTDPAKENAVEIPYEFGYDDFPAKIVKDG